VQLDQSSLARVHFRVLLEAGDAQLEAERIETEIEGIAQSWLDQFADRVFNQFHDDHERYEFMRIWGNAFDKTYQAEYPAEMAIADAIAIQDNQVCRFYVDQSAHIVLYSKEQQLKLSQVLPILTSFGLDVSDENPFEIDTPNGKWWIHNIGFSTTSSVSDFAQKEISKAIEELLRDQFEITELLRLIVLAELSLDDVIVLSTYVSYLSQWVGHSVAYINQVLIENSVVAKPLLDLLKLQFKNQDETQSKSIEVKQHISDVDSLEHDRILRALLQCIEATVRINFDTTEFKNTRLTVLKFHSTLIELMPEPRPMFEIWMDSNRVRGIHLRFGKVARGGLRWSDRLDDVRVEVLGLVRAQFSKNSIIVPTGAKGGFVPKRLRAEMSREEIFETGRASYQEFIRALLSITDNLQGTEIIQPNSVLIRDESDPYFVVAADKGTATFSDTANAIALEQGFWLGDAFASGGSKGYDHKAMGITAKGAWESVKHHLLLLGINIESEKVSVVGIGDMSGDVFGNGMLLSRNIQLIAAFDHRHIFIDPVPSDKAYAERKRLFELTRSSWEDFDAKVISKGGGVFSRSEKSITISSEAALALGIAENTLTFTPYELMSHILKAPVDLLYNGGIGTYVKSSLESHLDVGDKSNDALRINAKELRCRVVGEGGNLGFTQAARVEAALMGVAINTDAIDNSAGVDTSDHEVNLKILLARIDANRRDTILRDLTETVAGQVLKDNINQNEVLTLAEQEAHSILDVHKRMIEFLQRNAGLNPRKEGLPSSEEIERRNLAGVGLTRPELSVLLAYAKIHLRNELLKSTLVDEPWAEEWLFAYFPETLHQEFAEEIRSHRLRREITSTVLSNRIINLAGISALYRLMDETNSSIEQAVAALVITLAVNDIDAVHRSIVNEPVDWSSRIVLLREMRRCIDRSARWIISNRASDASVSQSIEFFTPAITTLRENLESLLTGYELTRWRSQASGYEALGFSKTVANRTAGLLDDYSAFDIAVLADEAKLDFRFVATTYFVVMDAFDGDQILSIITSLSRTDRWQTMARAALRADTYSAVSRLTRNVLKVNGDTPTQKLGTWQSVHKQSIIRVQRLIQDVLTHEKVDIASVSVAMRALRDLIRLTSQS
jgi:glutamate dehydrogenase